MTDARAGLLSGLAAYGFWGFAPVYFMWVAFAAPLEVLSHRILWATVILVPALWLLGSLGSLRELSAKAYGWLTVSALLLGTNWLVFVWALFNERMVETSLGYYINPLMSVALGVFFLAERPRPLQWLAVGIAALAIAHELYALQTVPYVALTLAVSFALYGFVRKRVGVPSFLGLTVETAVMLPAAVAYLIWSSGAAPSRSIEELAMLAVGGAVTIFPLLCFAYAALRIPLTTLGLLQYLAPSITLLLAVMLYDQQVSDTRWTTIYMIWAALAVFSAEGLYHGWRTRQGAPHAAG